MSPSDFELLQSYARNDPGAQAAFAALVARHLNLVYSVARRHVGSSQLAEDVAQSVFIDLARQAQRIDAATPIVAWLHVVSRRTAVDAVRRETRQQARHRAAADLHVMNPDPAPWKEIEPLLDEAVESLRPPHRSAILLRYFENKSLRDVGLALGVSDDAAQKRLARALEQLRTFLGRRGVTTTTAALASDLASSALQAAPASLGPAISSAVNIALAPAAVAGAPTLAMTTVQKSLVAGVFAVTAGFGVFEASVLHRQQNELSALNARSSSLAHSIQRTRAEHASLITQFSNVENQIDARLAQARAALAPSADDAALERQIETWLKNAARLKSFLATRPDLATPEMRLLTDENWSEIASKSTSGSDLQTEAGLARAAAAARAKAAEAFARRVHPALAAYVRSSGGALPATFSQLLPQISPPVPLDLFDGYTLPYAESSTNVPERERNNSVIVPRWVVDPEQDLVVTIGLMGWSSHSASSRRNLAVRPKP